MPERHQPFAGHPCAATHPSLVSNARMFLALAIGDSTRQTYGSGISSYISFIDGAGLSPAFPADVGTLCMWITSLAAPPRSLTVGTCKE